LCTGSGNVDENIGEEDEQLEQERPASGLTLVMKTMKQMLDPRQALIVVLVFYGGVEQGVFEADFNKVHLIVR
jgi:hypothetical protein